jgi:hypothetical protein
MTEGRIGQSLEAPKTLRIADQIGQGCGIVPNRADTRGAGCGRRQWPEAEKCM